MPEGIQFVEKIVFPPRHPEKGQQQLPRHNEQERGFADSFVFRYILKLPHESAQRFHVPYRLCPAAFHRQGVFLPSQVFRKADPGCGLLLPSSVFPGRRFDRRFVYKPGFLVCITLLLYPCRAVLSTKEFVRISVFFKF